MLKKLTAWFFPNVGRIFINYRRDDTQWAAGRLADSLAGYFDDKRVFRDIGGVRGGEDFTQALDATLEKSDALIAVLGPKWADELGDSENVRVVDWVAREIEFALEKGIRIYPVLVDGARMPPAASLPPPIREFSAKNAITLSDEGWTDDVKRLARIVGLDIPSAIRQKLTIANWAGVLLLWCSIIGILTVFAATLGQRVDGPWFNPYFWEWFRDDYQDACTNFPANLELLKPAFTVMTFVPIGICAAVLLSALRHIDDNRRKSMQAAIIIGAAGTITALPLTKGICTELEPWFQFLYAIVIAIAMLGCMSLSGFQSRQ